MISSFIKSSELNGNDENRSKMSFGKGFKLIKVETYVGNEKGFQSLPFETHIKIASLIGY